MLIAGTTSACSARTPARVGGGRGGRCTRSAEFLVLRLTLQRAVPCPPGRAIPPPTPEPLMLPQRSIGQRAGSALYTERALNEGTSSLLSAPASWAFPITLSLEAWTWAPPWRLGMPPT